MALPYNFANTVLSFVELLVVIFNQLGLNDFATTLSEKAHELLDDFVEE